MPRIGRMGRWFLRDRNATARLVAACAVLTAGATCKQPSVTAPPPDSLPDRWLLLSEPLGNAVKIGDTWNGSSVGTLCATGITTLDSTGSTEVSSSKDSSNASIGAKIAQALHFDASL